MTNCQRQAWWLLAVVMAVLGWQMLGVAPAHATSTQSHSLASALRLSALSDPGPGSVDAGSSGSDAPGEPGGPGDDDDDDNGGNEEERNVEGKFVWEEFGNRIDTSQRVQAQGPDLFGDQVNLMDGGLSFTVTDVSIPGNNALPVAFGRRYVVENRKEKITDSPLADWHVDLPHVWGTFAQDWTVASPAKQTVDRPTPHLERCAVLAPVWARPYGGAREVWNGNHLHLPGGGGGEMLLATGSTPVPPTGGPWYWTTSDFTVFRCLNTIDNGAGEGFEAVTPDGTRYRFAWMAQSHEPKLIVFNQFELERTRTALYVTRVEDRFGNWVNYNYSNAWNQPIRPTSIQSSDGRQLTFTYNATGQIASVSNGSRTWHYTYSAIPGTDLRSLSAVQLPDGSQWTLALSNFTMAAIDYPRPNPGPQPEPVRSCTWLGSLVTPAQAVASMTHPSGASGEFTIYATIHGRTHVPIDCQNVDQWPLTNKLDDDVNQWPISYHAWSLTRKRVTGPGLPTMDWNYQYQPMISHHYYPGSTPANPVCQIVDCSPPPCQSESCAGYTQTTVTGPGGDWLRYRYGNTYRYNEGKLLQVDSGTGPASILRSVSHAYDLSQATQAYPALYGISPRWYGDGFTSEYHRPQTHRQTVQQGTTFTWQVATGCGVGSHCFDSFARPTRVDKFNTLGSTKTEALGYFDHHSHWVLGQPAHVRDGLNGPYIEQTTYDPATALPTHRYRFGALIERRTYHTGAGQAGLPYEVFGGGNVKRTRLNNYYRGIPQLVTFHDNTTQTAAVNARGEIQSVTNELGHTTSYGYDVMGRLSLITHPGSDQTAWTPTSFNFVPVGSSEYGLPPGHWRLTQATGNHRQITYYDALWRPVLSREFDAGNEAATRRMTRRAFNHRGEETFVSYPKHTIPAYNTEHGVPGVSMEYDALGRPTSREADSELGVLTTSHAYLSGFQTRITNPRNQATLYSFQAFDQPDEAAATSIQQPLGITTSISRDRWGKPTAMTRSGTWSGGHQSLTRRFVYDSHQRLCKTIEPETGATVQQWNADNTLAWTASGQTLTSPTECQYASVPSGQRTTHSHDARNRLIALNPPGGTPAITFNWHPDGRLAGTHSDGSTWSYSYDKRGLLRNETLTVNGLSLPVTYGYTALGHRASIQYPDGVTVALQPNALGQPTQAGSWASLASWHPNGALAGFFYGDGHAYTLALNTRQLPLKRRELLGGNKLMEYNYDYDANGNVVGLYDLRPGGNENRVLSYDALDRMITAHGPELLGFEYYGYDALDNLRSASFTGSARADLHITWQMNAANRLASIHLAGLSHHYSHDARGNHTSGLNTALVPYTRHFNARNQLTSVNLPGQVDVYRYDGHGRRTSIQRNGQTTTQLYSREGQLLYERSPNGLVTRHIHLGGRLVASVVGGVTTYQHTDHLGSPIRRTNTAGTLTGMTIFAPYGSLVAGTVGQGPGFTGHVNDTGSGLVYMQQRHYDPIAMRFVSPDPVHVDTSTGSNFNRYWYANNNPYKYVDPDGRYVETVWDAANLAMGATSLVSNLQQGNWGSAALDAGGLFVDAVAAALPIVPAGAGAAISASRAADKAAGALSTAGRGRNNLRPDSSAEGAHSTFKHDSKGNISNTATYEPNPQNPSGFDEVKRVDITGKAHTNPDGTVVTTPHVHERGASGVRPATLDELPKKNL